MKLNIVEQLKTHGLDYVVDKFRLKLKDYGHKFLLKYDQLNSPSKNASVMECRGIILDKEFNVISLPFIRFFNYDQHTRKNIDWNTARIFEKQDGCCDENTILCTNFGDKTIKEICEYSDTELSKIKVLGYNHATNEKEFTEIINTLVQENNNDWYEIELENGVKVILTGNHQVFLPNINCYRSVDKLKEGDAFLLKK